jgi:hypothetical protein
MATDILYLCNKKACKNCHPEDCRHTSKIENAASFEKGANGCYIQCVETTIEPPKLIKTWNELKECISPTHFLVIDKHSGWIHPKNPKDPNGWDGNHYLSTYTFYSQTHEWSTKILQQCGFNVVIDNWDK